MMLDNATVINNRVEFAYRTHSDAVKALFEARRRDRAALDLVQRVARLNPDAGEIGPGMLATLVQIARTIHLEATGEQL